MDIEKAIWYATHLLNHLKGIDNKDMAKDVDDSVIEANVKTNMDEIVAKACDGNNKEYALSDSEKWSTLMLLTLYFMSVQNFDAGTREIKHQLNNDYSDI